MEEFRQSIEDVQKAEGVRTISHAHMLGWLDRTLPKRKTGKTTKPQPAEAEVAS